MILTTEERAWPIEHVFRESGRYCDLNRHLLKIFYLSHSCQKSSFGRSLDDNMLKYLRCPCKESIHNITTILKT